MNDLSITISGTQVDLFDDEAVSIVKQVKDLQDVGTLYSDYSQPFTLPASDRNNLVFEHWYHLDITDGINPHLKLPATISVEGIDLFVGMVELMNVVMKSGQPDSYEVVFYGDVTQLSTLWGQDTFRDVTYGSQIEYNYNNVTTSWTGGYQSGDVVFPIIDVGAHDGPFVYDVSAGADNSIGTPIRQSGAANNGINIFKLRPAFRFTKVLEYLFSHIGKTLTIAADTFDSSMYLFPMDREGMMNLAFGGEINVSKTSITIPAYTPPTTNDGLDLEAFTESVDPANQFDHPSGEFSPAADGTYQFTMYLQGVQTGVGSLLVEAYETGSPGTPITSQVFLPNSNTTSVYVTITIQAVVGDTYMFRLKNVSGNSMTISSLGLFTFAIPQLPFAAVAQWSDCFPDEEISEWMGKLIRAFNLVLLNDGQNGITMMRLDAWLTSGVSRDISGFVDTQKVVVNKQPLPTSVSLKHRVSEDFLSVAVKEANDGREYGEITYDNSNADFTGSAVEVESPVSVLPVSFMNRLNNGIQTGVTDLEVPQLYDNQGVPVHVPFSLWYFSGYQSVADTWYMLNGPTLTAQTSFPFFRPFEDRPLTGTSESLSYAYEIDPHNGGSYTDNTLYARSFKSYFDKVYNPLMKLLDVSAYIPLGDFVNIDMEDTLLIDGRGYKIERISYDTATQKADLRLFSYLEAVRPVPTFERPNGEQYFGVSWSSTPSARDRRLYNTTQIKGSNSGHYRFYPNVGMVSSRNILTAQKDIKNEYFTTPQLIDIVKTSSTTISATTSFTDVDDYQTTQLRSGTQLTPNLTDGKIVAESVVFLTIHATVEYEEQSNKDLHWAILKNGVDYGFKIFGSKDGTGVALSATFLADKDDEFTLAVSTTTGTSNVAVLNCTMTGIIRQ